MILRSLTLSLCVLYLQPLLSVSSELELRALMEFKKGIQTDPPNKVSSSWDLNSVSQWSSCPSSWYGVSCDPATGSITSISLDLLGLTGDLKFATLVNVKSLVNLSISGNQFTGRLVPAIGSMTSLELLDLSQNKFSGPIPERFSELWRLKHVNLSMNYLGGGFPRGFRNLQQLRVLDLHSNKFWGDIAEILGDFVNLDYVDLSSNAFYGGLDELNPQNVSSLGNTLRVLNVSGNDLSNGFLKPEIIVLFQNLQFLDLNNNRINGQLASFSSLPNLRILKLRNNQLFGAVPEELLNGTVPISDLDLSGNGFTGSIRGIDSTNLNALNLSSNGFSGDLPLSVKNCAVLDLSKNMISGEISIFLNWEAGLEVLDLSSNNLSGNLRNFTSQFSRLTKLNLRHNSLDGGLPPRFTVSSGLSDVDLSSNRLTGSISDTLLSSTNIRTLNLSNNQFSGPISLAYSLPTELLSLDLSHNRLTGSLPSIVDAFANLKLLNLSHNQFSGKIPAEFSRLTHLQYLDLSGNGFQGRIPNKLSSSLVGLNLSYNSLSGYIPTYLSTKFSNASFHPGNPLLVFLNGGALANSVPDLIPARDRHHSPKHHVMIAIVVAAIGSAVMIGFVLLAYQQAQRVEFRGRSFFHGGPMEDEDPKPGRNSQSSLLKFRTDLHQGPTSLSFSNDHLLPSDSPPLFDQSDASAADPCSSSGRKLSSCSPLASSIEEQSVIFDLRSPDRFLGELLVVDTSLVLTVEQLARAPAEILGRSSTGTCYRAILESGRREVTVKWLSEAALRSKKEFSREAQKIASLRHCHIRPLRAYYLGVRENDRLLVSDYVHGDNLAHHLYETSPSKKKHPLLSFPQRLRIAIDIAECLLHLHDRSVPHGNIKPTNILLENQTHNILLTDYALHHLLTPRGIADKMLNSGALGYLAPELGHGSKHAVPSLKADVYAFGVVLMELLTRKSAGDIISGQTGAVDLTDWVQLCDREGRRKDCLDTEILTSEEQHAEAMDDLLSLSLRCILPVKHRPNIRQVLEDVCSISSA